VLRAFIEPTLAFSRSGPGPSHFTTLIGRALAESDATIMPLFFKHIQPLFMLLYTTLCESLPALPKNEVYWRFHFALGSLIHTMKLVKNPIPAPDGLTHEADSEQLTEVLLNFVTAGMETSP
jgi:hypothetical protein